MTWVHVESSGGYRYAAPSHGRATPYLHGLPQLFQSPLQLRQLHTFTSLSANNPAVTFDGASGVMSDHGFAESLPCCVLIDQRDLGGRLGITTVAVGDETDGDDAGAYGPQLQRMLGRVFTILDSTNNRGVQILLDALCTRAPDPLTLEARAEAALVKEDDGGRRVPLALHARRVQRSTTPASYLDAGAACIAMEEANVTAKDTASNRQFLRRLTHDPPNDDDGDTLHGESPEPMILRPLSTNTAGPHPSIHSAGAHHNKEPWDGQACNKASARTPISTVTAAATEKPPQQPLNYMAALRRRSLLFFVPQDVVPLSMLAARVRIAGPAGTNFTGVEAPNAGAWPLWKTLGKISERVHAGKNLHGCTMSCDCYSAANFTVKGVELHCTSHLRGSANKKSLCENSADWTAVARAAEESARIILLVVMRLLSGSERTVGSSDRAALERLLLQDLWDEDSGRASHGSDPPPPDRGGHSLDHCAPRPATAAVPYVAAYSPSGLLVASSSFRRRIDHETHLLLAAAAIDRLACHTPPQPTTHSIASDRSSTAGVFSWATWPIRLRTDGSPTPGNVFDVLLLAIGDALAIYLIFPRVPLTSPRFSTATLASVQALLVAMVGRPISPRKSSPDVPRVLMDALTYTCTHSTAAYTCDFHDALYAVTTLEEALTFDSVPTEPSLTLAPGGAASLGMPHPHGETQGLGQNVPSVRASSGAAHWNNTAERATVSPAVAASQGNHLQKRVAGNFIEKSIRPKKKSGGGGAHPLERLLAKLFSCLPLCQHRSDKYLASSRQRYLTVAQQQSDVYVNDMKSATMASSSLVTNRQRAPPIGADGAALMQMSLASFLCYAAALVTRNELGTLRLSQEWGLHSFFFLQRHAAPAARHKPPCGSHGMMSICGCLNTAHADPTTLPSLCSMSTRYGISFARHRLQQSLCPAAVLPEEWADVEGATDGCGGGVTFLEDPALLLPHSAISIDHNACDAVGEGVSRSLDPRSSEELMQVSLLPTWSILQIAPAEELQQAESTDSGEDYVALPHISLVANTELHKAVPAGAVEDAQLVTSLRYVIPLKKRRQGNRTPSSPTMQLAASNVFFAEKHAAMEATPSTDAGRLQQSGDSAFCAAPKARKSSKSKAARWQVEALVNICGDLTGDRLDIVTDALLQYPLSSSSTAKMGARIKELEKKVASAPATAHFDDAPSDSECAVYAPRVMAELCESLALCQDAALTLIEGATQVE